MDVATTLSPSARELHLEGFEVDAHTVMIVLTTKVLYARCPARGQASERIHSRYTRTLADLPWQGIAVRLRLHTRRFFCPAVTCPRKIFTERLPETVAPYARKTLRLEAALHAIGLFVGGEAGARLAHHLDVAVSPDTLLRRLLARSPARSPAAPSEAPRVLGVDDWAWRKGQRYGTILIDLEAGRPVDLLPDRTADTLARWLQQHPGAEIIARDRSTEYARAIREAAPQVREVADVGTCSTTCGRYWSASSAPPMPG